MDLYTPIGKYVYSIWFIAGSLVLATIAIAHAVTYVKNKRKKQVWIIAIACLWLVGPLLYFAFRKRQ